MTSVEGKKNADQCSTENVRRVMSMVSYATYATPASPYHEKTLNEWYQEDWLEFWNSTLKVPDKEQWSVNADRCVTWKWDDE